MDLETFRQKRGLTYEDFAGELGFSQPRLMRTYCLGEAWPGAERLQAILDYCAPDVKIDDMHKRRLDYIRQRNAKRPWRVTSKVRI